jgi:uncharacterized protein YdaU (DUF1376 family)
MAKADIWMPLYIGDYMADTMHLSTVQHGSYFLIIIAYWKNRGPLPDDDTQFSAISKLSLKEWLLNRPVIAKFFQIVEGFWIQKRIDEEIKKAANRKEVASENGKRGGRPNQSNKKPSGLPSGLAVANLAGIPAGNPEHNPEKSSSPSPSLDLTQTPARAKQSDFDLALQVLNAYPVKAKKDGRVIRKDMHAQNLLAIKIAKSPDFPWLEAAELEGESDTPRDLIRWAETMPDPVNLESMRIAKTTKWEKANGTNRTNPSQFESKQERQDRKFKDAVASLRESPESDAQGDSPDVRILSQGNA